MGIEPSLHDQLCTSFQNLLGATCGSLRISFHRAKNTLGRAGLGPSRGFHEMGCPFQGENTPAPGTRPTSNLHFRVPCGSLPVCRGRNALQLFNWTHWTGLIGLGVGATSNTPSKPSECGAKQAGTEADSSLEVRLLFPGSSRPLKMWTWCCS